MHPSGSRAYSHVHRRLAFGLGVPSGGAGEHTVALAAPGEIRVQSESGKECADPQSEDLFHWSDPGLCLLKSPPVGGKGGRISGMLGPLPQGKVVALQDMPAAAGADGIR